MSGRVYKYDTKGGTRWRIVYDGPAATDPVTGKTVRRQTQRCGFAREKEAKEALRQAEAELAGGRYVEPVQVTLRTYLTDEWLPSVMPRAVDAGRRHRGTVSAATHDRYRRDLVRYVLPHLGGHQLQDLTPADIDGLYDQLERDAGSGRPLSAKTIANLHAVLHKALGDGVRRGRIKRSPADGVSPPTASMPPARWWSVDELRRFLRSVADRDDYGGWLLFATTGAREGEDAGLSWADLDLDAGTMRVDWTLGEVDGKLTWKPRPKSRAGERPMALDPTTVAVLRDHQRRQLEDRALAGPAWTGTFPDWQGLSRSELVWTYGDGSPIRPVTWYRTFVRLAAEAGLPRIRLHDVRHSHASAALASATGWHEVKVISQRLGHANVAITLDTYSHVLPAADETVAHTLARVILEGP